MRKKIFIINGPAGSGKDTFVSMVSSLIPTVNYSSVDLVKKAASILGWSGTKTDKDRKFLSDLKNLSSEYSDTIIDWILNKAKDFVQDEIHEVMFIHVREPDEIDKLAKILNSKTVLVVRSGINPNQSNSADANVLDYDYDITIDNCGSLGDLKVKAGEFVNNI